MSDLKTHIAKPGQKYLDEPVYVLPKQEPFDVMKASIALALGGEMPKAKPPILVRHERVTLRWMKPDGKGGLVPR